MDNIRIISLTICWILTLIPGLPLVSLASNESGPNAQAEQQFAVADHRSAQAVADIIRQKGYDPVWKDWDAAFLQTG